jgi:glyoxylase-like metal-dependent hydrolase (beta-lactamase superfamily II)
MIFKQTGHIVDRLHVLGHAAIPVYLVDDPVPVLFDAGFACLARRYIRDIASCLNGRRPSYCFLTHAHFDHCGALAAFKQAFPRMRAAASEAAKAVLSRPGALERIRQLNRAAEQMVRESGIATADIGGDFEPFDIDRPLCDGERVRISSTCTVQVIATPGHTRDCLSYYLPEKKLLVCSEAAGQPDQTGHIVSDCLLDYDQYLASLRKLSRLDVRILCLGHMCVYTDDSVQAYMARALDACLEFRRRVERVAADEDGDVGRMIVRIKADEYDCKPGPKQPEPAYLVNLEARIKAVLNAREA